MLNGELRVTCPACGSLDTDVTDRRFSDEGFRVVCNSCGYREFRKDLDDFDTITINIHPNRGSGKADTIRGRAFRRKQNYAKAVRKQRITKDIYYSVTGHPYYPHLHQYSKNKIHCSCPLCASKSKTPAGRNIKPSEAKRIGLYNLKRQTNGLNRLTHID